MWDHLRANDNLSKLQYSTLSQKTHARLTIFIL